MAQPFHFHWPTEPDKCTKMCHVPDDCPACKQLQDGFQAIKDAEAEARKTLDIRIGD